MLGGWSGGGARGRASSARTREASGLRLPAQRPGARSSLTGPPQSPVAKPAALPVWKPVRAAAVVWNRRHPQARSRGRKTPRWSAERRAGQRHWPVIPGDPGIGPTARRATGCGVPHPAPVGAPLPSPDAGGTQDDGAPAPPRIGAAKLGQNLVGWAKAPDVARNGARRVAPLPTVHEFAPMVGKGARHRAHSQRFPAPLVESRRGAATWG